MLTWIFDQYRTAYGGLPKPVWMMASVMFANTLGAMVVPFLSIYMTSEMGVKPAAAGKMIGLFGFGALFGGPLGGWLSEKIEPIAAQIGVLIVQALLLVLIPSFTSLLWISVLLFFVGIFNSAFMPCNSASIGNYCHKSIRTRGFAMQRLAMNAGWAIGPGIGGFLATIQFSWIFFADGLTCLIAAVLAGIFLVKLKAIPKQEEEPPEEKNRSSLMVCLTDSKFLLVLFFFLLALLCFLQLKGAYSVYLKDIYGLLESKIGLLFTLNATMVVAFEMILAKRLEHLPRLKLAGLGYFLVGLGLALLPFGQTYFMAGLSMFILTLGEMIGIPPTMAWIADRGNTKTRGMYMGFFTSTLGLSMILAPIVGLGLYDLDPNLVWYSMFATGCLVWFGYLVLSRYENRPAATSSAK